MRREWLVVPLAIVLLGPAGCGPPTSTIQTVPGGLSDSASQNVQVNAPVINNRPPKADISGPISGLVGETLSFSGAGSTDSDGQIVSYAWDFGDGTTGSGVSVSHAYNAAGSYLVTLTVTDDGQGTGQIVAQAQVAAAGVSPQTYKVQQGDTLMGISRKLFNGDPHYWDEIANLNNLKAPYTIYPGQELKVPEKK